MTRPPTTTPLQRLQEAGKLILVRSGWCRPEPGKGPDDYYQVLAVADGLKLVNEKRATITIEGGKQVLRPA